VWSVRVEGTLRSPSAARRSGGPTWRLAGQSGVAEEARTRGFAAPAFAGCAFVVGLAILSYRVMQRLSSDQQAARCGFPQVKSGSAYPGPGERLSPLRPFGGIRWLGYGRRKGKEYWLPNCVTMLTLSRCPLCYSYGLETFLSLNSEGAPHGTSYCRI
jgi:hypothetical protein